VEKTVRLNLVLIIAEARTEELVIKESVSAKMDGQVLVAISKLVLIPARTTENASKENANAKSDLKESTVQFQFALTTVAEKDFALEPLIINALVTKVLQELTVLSKNVLTTALVRELVIL